MESDPGTPMKQVDLQPEFFLNSRVEKPQNVLGMKLLLPDFPDFRSFFQVPWFVFGGVVYMALLLTLFVTPKTWTKCSNAGEKKYHTNSSGIGPIVHVRFSDPNVTRLKNQTSPRV